MVPEVGGEPLRRRAAQVVGAAPGRRAGDDHGAGVALVRGRVEGLEHLEVRRRPDGPLLRSPELGIDAAPEVGLVPDLEVLGALTLVASGQEPRQVGPRGLDRRLVDGHHDVVVEHAPDPVATVARPLGDVGAGEDDADAPGVERGDHRVQLAEIRLVVRVADGGRATGHRAGGLQALPAEVHPCVRGVETGRPHLGDDGLDAAEVADALRHLETPVQDAPRGSGRRLACRHRKSEDHDGRDQEGERGRRCTATRRDVRLLTLVCGPHWYLRRRLVRP